jgi:hypothetical protein
MEIEMRIGSLAESAHCLMWLIQLCIGYIQLNSFTFGALVITRS